MYYSHYLSLGGFKIIIRFAKTITKDHVFSAMRDIVQSIGVVLADGRPVDLQFSVGNLVGKDRKIKFVFIPELLKLVRACWLSESHPTSG